MDNDSIGLITKIMLMTSFVFLFLSGVFFVVDWFSSAETTTYPRFQIPECKTEDSDNCFWNAQVRGNGEGRSFIVLDGRVFYEKE